VNATTNAVIAEYLSATTLKSLTNRVNSALEKDGTPAQLLRGASQSINALIAKTADDGERAIVSAFAYAFEVGAEIAKRGTEPTAKAPKQTREVWADTQEEAIALKNAKAEKPAKPAKRNSRAILNEMNKSEMADLIAQLLSVAKQ
jgi:hypothetical protein